VAVFGRRRVGKTFLIRKAFEGQFCFQLTGLAKEGVRGQLNNFHAALLRVHKTAEELPKSALQNINDLCFAPGGFMRAEFGYLFASLFKQSDRHLAVVETLAQKSKGMTRSDLLLKSKLANGGHTSKVLLELEESNFIRKYNAFGNREKNAVYQLTDFYTFFYLKFIRPSDTLDNYVWGADVPEFTAWSGYAFEQVCLLHAPQLKKALNIGGVITRSSAWTGNDGERKVQIDLVIDRRDGVINLCEMKFSTATYTITKAYAAELREKVRLFKEITQTKKAIYLTMVTTYGLTRNDPETGLIQNQLTMDALFVP
jgi:uncharacterized protein